MEGITRAAGAIFCGCLREIEREQTLHWIANGQAMEITTPNTGFLGWRSSDE
ncbi:hypothetical protein WG66_002768 [Moniliophthora roreri]|nr:hypothetical protein WG66_002768 [Moniliophthora roreri]